MKTQAIRFHAIPQSESRLHTLIVHSNPHVARGLGILLGAESRILVVASATNIQHGSHWARIKQPDVVVLDAELPQMSPRWSIACIREAAPAARFVLIASRRASASRALALRDDATVVTATDSVDVLIKAVERAAFRGGPSLASYLSQGAPGRAWPRPRTAA